MYRIALILGLLITPAVADENYTEDECATLAVMFNNCAKIPPKVLRVCGRAYNFTRAEAANYRALIDNHPSWKVDGECKGEGDRRACWPGPIMQGFLNLCQQVCDRSISLPEALGKYCQPKRPPS
ncbi:hypothetical protein [Bradyrhizobium sp. 2S1]|uniref:hypothetical protein n=1 Tax=Bradyrhizobium sp. 2S1 TaxID=1404429 RepID=UPI00140805AA|nr:hypothetical protein [Bradyrhizobium sp. 2S1]MCK7666440.1 hypothetical protein [Bradyrhizobium sp. 2S1]